MPLTTNPAEADPAKQALDLLKDDPGDLYRFFEHWTWLVAIGVAATVALILLVRWWRARPAPPPPSARSIALRDLERLRKEVEQADPYQFSGAVSDVLRTYIGGHYGLKARQQTSPEFLASIAESEKFSAGDRELLGGFLEKCDLIKFAHVDATSEDSRDLLGRAIGFVQGDRV